MKRYIVLPVFLVFIDQIIKRFIRMLPEGKPFFSIEPFFELLPCTNHGAAFSLFAGKTIFLIFLGGIMLFALCLILRKMQITAYAHLALSVLIGGGIGNLADRILYGGVTDYIRLLFIPFPVFNFADICVTLSIGVLLILNLTDKLEKHTEETNGIAVDR